ncbi:MAG: HD domain-containing phosphohydrolase [Dictyoglomus turgidum]|uniref:HD domain-containing phosphohydrolase n=1 Tax=Dictyoglomus turgidum TaxID=513050 RepID=UPI003C77625D
MNEEKILEYLKIISKIKKEEKNFENVEDFIFNIQNLLKKVSLKIFIEKNKITVSSENLENLDEKDNLFIHIITEDVNQFLEGKNYSNLFNELTISLIEQKNVEDLLDAILEKLEKIIPYTSANIALLENDALYYLSFRGYEKYGVEDFMRNFKMDKREFYTLKTVMETQKPLFVENTDEYPNWVIILETQWIKSHLMIPIIYENKILGLISFDSDTPYGFKEEDIEKVYPLLPLLGIALENAKLYEKLKKELEERIIAEEKYKRSFYQIVKLASDIVEMKDPYTSGHQKRVARISVIIGKELGLSHEKIRALAISSLLHDIGKIGIPSEILNKPSSLNPLERRFINIHPEIGYNLLRKIEIISDIAPIVYQHHERINGSGYPKGLKGEEILLEAKIIGVADVFEAMTSHRPYRSALPIDMAIKELVENKGTLYDPDVVDAFLKSLKEGRIIL